MARGFSWLAVGNGVNAACSWARIAFLARLGNAEMIGVLVLALAVCNPIGALADLGLSGALVSDARRQYSFGEYLALRLLTGSLTLAVIVAIALLGGFAPATARLISLAGLLIVLESIGELFQAAHQQHGRMDWAAISLVIRGLLGLALFALGVWATGSLAVGVSGFSLSAVITLFGYDAPRVASTISRLPKGDDYEYMVPVGVRALLSQGLSSLCPHWSRQVLARLAWLTLPLGLATAAMALTNSIPRYLIDCYLGSAALGGFAVAGSLMIATALVVGALSQAAGPRLAEHYAAGDRAAFARVLTTLLGWVAASGAAMTLIMAIFGEPVLRLLYGSEFVRYADVALCLMAAAALRNLSVPLGRAISSTRSFKTNLVLRIVGIAVLVTLLPGWIAWLGLLGAAWAVLLSWLVTDLLAAAAVLRILRSQQTPLAVWEKGRG